MRQNHFPALVFVLLAMVLALCPAAACRPIQTGATGSQAPVLLTPSFQSADGHSSDPRPQPLAPNAAAADPVLYFSDITSGPKSGNSDTSGGRSGLDGAIVTIWGANLGSTQGSSIVYINGAEAASTYT